jgi:type II secretory pathway component PulF
MGAVAYGAIGLALMAVLVGLMSSWAVLHLFGHTRSWPWRVADLQRKQPYSQRSRQVRQTHQKSKRPRHSGRHRDRRVAAEIPAAIDLLHIAVSAGHSLHTAVAAVAGSGTGVVIDGLAEVQRCFERGGRLTDELAKLPDRLGPEVQPLSTTLIVAASSGAPLGPTLQRLADAQRRRVRRHTEERVRKLPVLLLAPLITLVLPAFVLLTVVPVAITTARTGLAPIQNSLPTQNSIPLPNTDPVASPP